MRIALAITDEEIQRCYPALSQLRPHISEGQFLERIRQQMQGGYELAYLIGVPTPSADSTPLVDTTPVADSTRAAAGNGLAQSVSEPQEPPSRASETERVLTVAGFRMGLNLACGKYLYVDDLVTAEVARSSGWGRQMLSWLMDLARSRSCDQFHLDSGLQRREAHRFYEREGMEISSYHFFKQLH